MIFSSTPFFEFLFLTLVYSILGWILEFFHRLFVHRKIINPGLLYGPYLPMYGFSALAIVVLYRLFQNNLWLTVLSGTALITFFEYVVGTISEKYLGTKLWDYSNQKFNIQGRVCLLYTFLWSILITVFLVLIHPAVQKGINPIPQITRIILASFVLGAIFFDLVLTVTNLFNIRNAIAEINKKTEQINLDWIKSKVSGITRLMRSFPYFRNEVGRRIQSNSGLIDTTDSIHEIIDTVAGGITEDTAYYAIVADILNNEEFKKTALFKHHYTTIYEHSLFVSYYSYNLAKKMKLDTVATARGALLHDFFLYDWRKPHPEKGKNHGLEHPKTALRNASKQFALNATEKDIIINHMWPFTLNFPKTREALLVLFVDKKLASKEFFYYFKSVLGNRIGKTIGKIPLNKNGIKNNEN